MECNPLGQGQCPQFPRGTRQRMGGSPNPLECVPPALRTQSPVWLQVENRADGEQSGHGGHSWEVQRDCRGLCTEKDVGSSSHAALVYVGASQEVAFENKLQGNLLSSQFHIFC